MDFPPDALPRQSDEAQLATVPSFAPAPLEFPPLEGSIATQFPDPLAGNAEQQYRSIDLHGCMFYVAAEGDMLRLDDVHVQDNESGQWSRPISSGDLPRQAALYQQVPWVKEKHGDYMKLKETELEVLKVFLIRRDPQTQLLDFHTVVALDAEQRAIVREEVVTTTDVTDPEQLSLRIRDGRITLELSPAMPSIEEVVQAAMEDREPESDMPEMPQLQEAPAEEEEEEEIDDDFDAPDIPAIDFA